jgi:hypothetical protein
MGRRVDIPWVGGGQNTIDNKGVKILFNIPWVWVIKIPWVRGSKYHGSNSNLVFTVIMPCKIETAIRASF